MNEELRIDNEPLSRFITKNFLVSRSAFRIHSYFCSPNHSFGTFREVAEWSNATDSKSVIPATVSGVRIPPSLQKAFRRLESFLVVSLSVATRPRGVAEWSIAAVLKTADCNRSGGSNPSSSAEKPVSYLETGFLLSQGMV
jgi:hypothetical protein